MRTIYLIALFIAALLILPGETGAQGVGEDSLPDRYTLLTNSRLAIEGTSTVDGFVCESSISVESSRKQDPVAATERGARVVSEEAGMALIVPVESFDCGKARMNRDMYKALQAASHPNVTFRLDGVEVLTSRTAADNEYELQVAGRLSLAGAERDVVVRVVGSELADGRVRAQGAVTLLMSDFGVTPPTALLGLVRAHDRIKVAFDLFGRQVQAPHASR